MHNQLSWFPFYTRDWFTDLKVRMMGPVARAYFLELLRTQWDEGSIPAPKTDCALCGHKPGCPHRLEPIRRILNMPQDPCCDGLMDGLDYDQILEQVLSAFSPDGNGGLINCKLKKIKDSQEKLASSKRQGAEKTNQKRWPGSDSDRSAIAQRSLSDPARIFDVKRKLVAIAAQKGMP